MNGLYIYEDHMGGLYTSEEYFVPEFCEMCGDSDWCVGFANNREQAWGLLEDLCYSVEYLTEFIDSHWEE